MSADPSKSQPLLFGDRALGYTYEQYDCKPHAIPNHSLEHQAAAIQNLTYSNLKVANLGDLTENQKIDDLLEAPKLGAGNIRPASEDISMKPMGAARVKLTIEYNQEKRKYLVSEEDRAALYRYDIDFNQFKATTQRIEGNIEFRPFDHKQPLWRSLGLKLFTIVFLLIFLYVGLLIL